MGTKYRPSIKDQKATQRFHQNARRKVESGPVKHLLHFTAKPKEISPKQGTESPNSGR
jgi:hypothetical protein